MKRMFLIRILIIVLMLLAGINIWQFSVINSLREVNSSQLQTIAELKVNLKDSEQKIKDFSKKEELNPIERKVQVCMKQKNYTTAGMSLCVNDSIADWNNEINKYLSRFQSKLSKEQHSFLNASQLQWEKYQKAEWQFLNSAIGTKEGTMYINILSASKADIVEQRAKDLESLFYILFPEEQE